MLEVYLADVPLTGARVLEIGCGSGAICRRLARDASTVLGVDPSPVFVQRAKELAPELNFRVADGRELPFGNDTFDVVVCHTTLCHIPGCERVLEEARRVASHVVIFEGDYATTTVAITANDPLQPCVEATIEGLVHDRWLVRRLPKLLEDAGWAITRERSLGYTETAEPGYALTLVDRGAKMLAAAGTIGEDTARALQAEARRRVDAGTFYGHINYASFAADRAAATV
jgi:SAM-dependent methyltransferase